MTPRNPRRAAFDILLRVEKERSYADILIDRELTSSSMKGNDRRLFTELVYGVLRRKGSLDHIISQFSAKPPEKLDAPVLVLLRLGIYQFFYLDRIPVSAAVNETVKITREVAPRAAGFVNAVLRRTSECKDNISFPDREPDLALHLAVRHSHPLWLTRQWVQQLGPQEAEELAKVMASPAPVTLRANSLKITRSALQESLHETGLVTTPTTYSPFGLLISISQPIRTIAGFAEGLFTIQDESSQIAALLLAPRPGETVVDVCAAPGGKTTLIAELMENKGTVIACDIRQQRINLVNELATRLGLTCITTLLADALKPLDHILASSQIPSVDRVLVDAPCSGLGTIRRNPEGKWWKNDETICQMAANQKIILQNAAHLVKPDGVVLYSTCTTSVEENEEVITAFLAANRNFILENLKELLPDHTGLFTDEGYFRAWPHRHGMDGFFAARLRRIE